MSEISSVPVHGTGGWRRMRGRPVTLSVILVLGGIVMLAPFIWMVSAAFSGGASSLTLPPKWLPVHFTLGNFSALNSPSFPVLHFMQNSLVVSVVSTAGMLATSALAGYAFAKFSFRGRNLLFGLFLLSLMVPIQVTIIPLFVIMGRLGLINSLWSLMLPALLGAFAPGLPGAFGVFMMRQFFRGIPDSLLEAAALEGAGRFTVFRRIALPLAKPALASLGVITFILSWNEYFSPLVFLNSTSQMTLPVGIQSLRPPFGQSSNTVLAAVAVSVLPMLIVFLAGQRWIVQGFLRSGLNE
jgi:multiple sugar transport system permease protein